MVTRANLPTDDEVLDACSRVVRAQTPQEFETAITDLQIALRDFIADMENKAILMLLDHPKLKARAAKERAKK